MGLEQIFIDRDRYQKLDPNPTIILVPFTLEGDCVLNGVHSLGKGNEKSQGRLFSTFQDLKQADRKAGESLITRAFSDRTRKNSLKPKEGGFRLGVRKKFFTGKVKTLLRH